MKNMIGLLLLVLASGYVKAQNDTDELVRAELNFAKVCSEKGIRTSFLMNVDTVAVTFEGINVVNAYQFLLKDTDGPGLISWTPSYAEMANSGNWGYTTGNYEVRAEKLADTIISSGQYTTVWHKNDNDDWKYLIDLGIYHKPVLLERYPVRVGIKKYNSSAVFENNGVLEIEKAYIKQLKANPDGIYEAFYSQEFILNLNRFPPLHATSDAEKVMKLNNTSLQYEPLGMFAPESKDMAAVYGLVSLNGKKSSYLRIWRNEKTGWRIALEVLRI